MNNRIILTLLARAIARATALARNEFMVRCSICGSEIKLGDKCRYLKQHLSNAFEINKWKRFLEIHELIYNEKIWKYGEKNDA